MNRFDYEFPVRIHFGQGCFEESLKKELPKYGKKVMLAYGGGSLKRTGLYDRIVTILTEAGKTVVDFAGIMPNPTYAKVLEGARLAREQKVDFILAVGGGSVSDCCKIVASLTPNPSPRGEGSDYLQTLNDDDLWKELSTPLVLRRGGGGEAVPLGVVVTASGTGSEQNNGAVITHEEKKQKSPLWGSFADFTILDPDLTKTVPMRQVISGAFDTLSHCMETYFGHPHATNLSDEINEAVQRSVIANLKAIAANPDDDHARSELMWASAMGENGILKLGKQTDFQCHMLEHQLGAYTDCNHGQGLAVLHPTLYRHIYQSASEKFNRWAQEVWLVLNAEDGIDALEDLIRAVGLPTTLTEMGITLDDATRRAIADSTIITPGCCKQLTADELYEILKECE
ncbi:MAG: iron-containing alcohol dehydrogenase [Prevotella sp.]|nr:iron-containing alcohol dehydrogenase [Prevotella sp.]